MNGAAAEPYLLALSAPPATQQRSTLLTLSFVLVSECDFLYFCAREVRGRCEKEDFGAPKTKGHTYK
jgi:hypothetical protein